MNDASSPDLMRAVASGDIDAFAALYDRHSGAVYALLLRILGSAEDSQEVLQDTFLKAWSAAEAFDSSRGSEGAWLVSIARSRAIDRLRSRKTRLTRETEAAKEISIHSSSVDPAGPARVIEQEQKIAVGGALAALPQEQRVALELAYFGGLSQSEIAEQLGQPLGTVKTRMQLGMKKLRESLRAHRP